MAPGARHGLFAVDFVAGMQRNQRQLGSQRRRPENYTIELGPRDVEIPFIRNSHHYFLVRTRVEESDRGDAFNIMVNRPVLGDNPTVEQYSWFSSEKSDHGIIFTDQSTVHFDEMDSDSTWTANLDLYAQDCRSGFCSDTLPRLHITGRFRYWIPEEDR